MQAVVQDVLFNLPGVAADEVDVDVGVSVCESCEDFWKDILGQGGACPDVDCAFEIVPHLPQVEKDFPFFFDDRDKFCVQIGPVFSQP